MSHDDHLTDQELNWLLTQEAKAAAKTLRQGVARLSLSPPADTNIADTPDDIESSLAALDDAMRMLDSLNARSDKRSSRGPVDLAALLVDIVPLANLRFEPGSGAEVHGDDADLRRMIQVLAAHAGSMIGGPEFPEVTLVREGDEVRVSVALGPEAQSGDGIERAWLERMAARHGGRLELDGGQESLVLPVGRSQERVELDLLRKERDAALQQSRVLARELSVLYKAKGGAEGVPLDVVSVPPRASAPTVFVVEPEEPIRRMLEALVQGSGRRAVGFTKGSRALEAAVLDPPDMVLLALDLPGTYDGFDVCRELRSNPGTARVPIIVISSLGGTDARIKVADAGATAFFTKPFGACALLREMDVLTAPQPIVVPAP